VSDRLTSQQEYARSSEHFANIRPKHVFGYINPVPVSDFIHYQFYSVFPAGSLLTAYHLGLAEFSARGVDTALQAFWPAFNFLANRKVERISLGGIPLSAFATRPRILEMLSEARKKTDIPVTTDFEETIEGLKSLGIRRVAVTAKWDETLMQAVADYCAHAGIEVLGIHGEAHTAQQVVALAADESIAIAVRLAEDAMAKMPNAEGILLAGGAWLVLQALPIIEARTGKPVVNNPAATYWAALKQAGLQCQVPGLGKLLDSTRSTGK
jgi:maleate cis-trans isomerase